MRFGHSKDHRADLVQFKQGLGSLDPAGVPLLTNTVAGHAAHDPLYLPAWREMVKTIGHTHFLYVADCKAAALATRAAIDQERGFYLFPMPLTGDTPACCVNGCSRHLLQMPRFTCRMSRTNKATRCWWGMASAWSVPCNAAWRTIRFIPGRNVG